MLDGSLLFQKHITKWTENTQKCPKQRGNNMSYVSHDRDINTVKCFLAH